MSLWRMGIQVFWVIVTSKFCLQFTDLWGAWCLVPGLLLLAFFLRYDYRQWYAWAQRGTAQQQQQQQQRSQHPHRQGPHQSQAYRQGQQQQQQQAMQMAYIDDLMWEDGLLW